MNYNHLPIRRHHLVILIMLMVCSLSAAPHMVTNTSDDVATTGSLRQVVNLAISGDTIVFDDTLNGMPITLSSQIAANKNLVIIGNGPDATIMDGGSGTHRLFDLFGTWVFENITFRNGGSDQVFGGAIISNTSLTIVNCIFHSNTAHAGGAIYTSGITKIYNSLFYSNKTIRNEGLVTSFGINSIGGAIHHNTGTLSVIGCSIVNNSAVDGGGGIRSIVTSGVSLINNIITFNTSTSGSPDVMPGYAPISAANNLIGNYTGSGIVQGGTNLTGDPMFIDTLADDYRLKSTSPAINAGESLFIPSGITTDLDGNPRIRQTTVDIGAYEGISCIVPDTLYVDITNTNPTAPADGSSWDAALTDLQEAINISNSCPGDRQIWVAKGTYRPTQIHNLDNNTTFENREKTFYLSSPVQIYGGFDGNETDLDQRDSLSGETILTGDLGNNQDTAYHVMVMTADDIRSDWKLDGLVIRHGRALGANFEHRHGGGIYAFVNPNSPGRFGVFIDPQINNSTITNNNAQSNGGGLYINLNHTDNSDTDISPQINNSTFSHNKAQNNGGAIYAFGVAGFEPAFNPQINNSNFSYNYAQNNGGGIFASVDATCTEIIPHITNSIFTNNTADNNGGGIYLDPNNRDHEIMPKIINSTFYNNVAQNNGGGIYISNPIASFSTTESQIKNSVLWDNKATLGSGDDIFQNVSGGSISHSILSSATSLVGGIVVSDTIVQDPLFVDALNNDLRPQPGSPAINAGDNAAAIGITIDLDGNPRTTYGIVDMGAYEFGGCPDVPLSFSPPNNFGGSEMQLIRTDKTITADNMISGTATVTYDGKTGVCFGKNFEVGVDAVLIAKTNGCPNEGSVRANDIKTNR